MPNKPKSIRKIIGQADSLQGKSENICVFVHFDHRKSVADYVLYYLDQLKNTGCDIVVVSTAPHLTEASINKLTQRAKVLIHRKNTGYDFGSYKTGLWLIDGSLNKYKRLILANDSVYGPFFDLTTLIKHGDNRRLDVWGATDSLEIAYHLQSYFLVFSRRAFLGKTFKQFWSLVRDASPKSPDFKRRIIEEYEIGGSQCYATSRLKLGALCPIRSVMRSQKANTSPRFHLGHHSRRNQTAFDWDIIIERFGCPFIKRELLSDNPANADTAGWRKHIAQNTAYPIRLIDQDLRTYKPIAGQKKYDWFFTMHRARSGIEVPYFISQLLTAFPDLSDKKGVDFGTVEGTLNAIAWWENPGRFSIGPDILWPFDNCFDPVLFERDPGVPQDASSTITRGGMAVYRTREDLREQFSLKTKKSRDAFVDWLVTHGTKHYRFLGERLQKPMSRRSYKQVSGRYAAIKSRRGGGTRSPRGVNVLGFPLGTLGIGEDARVSCEALLRAGIPNSLVQLPIPLNTDSQIAPALSKQLREFPTFRTNIVCAPAADCYQTLLRGHHEWFLGRYNICAWQWELPHWPEDWKPLLKLADEIWAISGYVAEMFRSTTNKPVAHMPLGIPQPMFRKMHRKAFGIPSNAFTFVTVFDCNSWIKRKNPMGSVLAFQKAFARRDSTTCLVVKLMNGSNNKSKELQALYIAARKDPRIVIIDETIPKSKLWALLDCGDAFISLHRAEGFGRLIAEAMLIGKPVISTNFSGSLDFANKDTCLTVDGPIVALQPGDYVRSQGQHWMDPDIDHAANRMKECRDGGKVIAKLASRGQKHVAKHHSVDAVATRYIERLNAIQVIPNDWLQSWIQRISRK